MKVDDPVEVGINTGEKVGLGKITVQVMMWPRLWSLSNAHGVGLIQSGHHEVGSNKLVRIGGNSICPKIRVANSFCPRRRKLSVRPR